MIKYMTARTSMKTGRTTYRVVYDSGRHVRERIIHDGDDWPMAVVKFFTADDTRRTRDEIIGEGEYATRFELFEK